MAETERCCAPDCQQAPAARLDIRPLCRNHFILASYEQIDEYLRQLEENRFRDTALELVRRFLSECTRQATDLAQNAQQLDNLERARLLDILLRASELGRHLRRSPRKVISVPVRVCCERLGRAWEQETVTRVLSRHGASLECSHPVEVGEALSLTRLDTGTEVRARVAWQQMGIGGSVDIGVEFQHCDNFWGIDWSSAENALWQPEVPRARAGQ